ASETTASETISSIQSSASQLSLNHEDPDCSTPPGTALLPPYDVCRCHRVETATDCCINFRAMIPLKKVVSLRTTSSSCPRKALIFTTKTEKTFCVDPSEAWVQSHVTKIESRQR
uniref:Chemokine interleukin-8-like domain-containing protein n=1 Tax=Hucho hucho TaxID=62062 RepID=A0A4W5LV80_9TELE